MGAPVMMNKSGAARMSAAANDLERELRSRMKTADSYEKQAVSAPANGAAAASIAYLAAAPLIGGAVMLVARPYENAEVILSLMASYGAALVLFFAGVRWGVAVMRPEGPTMRALAGAALPFALGMPLLAGFDATLRIGALMALMLILLIDDLGATRRGHGAPAWYLGVRAPLTALVQVAFVIALAAAMR